MLARDWRHVVTEMGLHVRHTRHLLGWSQDGLARKAGTSQGAVSRLEAGHAGDAPLRSVVTTLQALSAGLATADLPVSPAVGALFLFGQIFRVPFTLADVANPDLTAYVQAFHRLPAERRQAVLRLIEAVVDLFGTVP